MIIWINGGFGAGKTTLAEELHRRLPKAVVYNPEDVGLMLWKWMPPNGDFQHLPSWRELVVETALSLRRHHADTLIVPMSLIRDAYRAEILGGLAGAGEDILHVFLEADAGVLRERLNARVTNPGRDWDQAARESGMTGVDEMVAAAARQPTGTLMLRSAGSPRSSWPTKCWPSPACAGIPETARRCLGQARWTPRKPRPHSTPSGAGPWHIQVEPDTCWGEHFRLPRQCYCSLRCVTFVRQGQAISEAAASRRFRRVRRGARPQYEKSGYQHAVQSPRNPRKSGVSWVIARGVRPSCRRASSSGAAFGRRRACGRGRRRRRSWR
jgi:hypothetical protein